MQRQLYFIGILFSLVSSGGWTSRSHALEQRHQSVSQVSQPAVNPSLAGLPDWLNSGSGLVDRLLHLPGAGSYLSSERLFASRAIPASGSGRLVRIVGGTIAPNGAWPWMAALRFTGSNSQFCGGALIKPNYVLTAAHCITETGISSPSQLNVLLGTNNLKKGGQKFKVSQIKVHPQWDPATFSHDVALLKLATSSTQQRIAIATPLDKSYFAAGDDATVTGWGLTSEGGSPSKQLQQVTIPIVSNPVCNAAYGGGIFANMICAGLKAGGKDSCQGDSGGPLMVQKGKKWLHAGIVSFGNGCARPHFYGGYTRTAFFDGWIRQNSR